MKKILSFATLITLLICTFTPVFAQNRRTYRGPIISPINAVIEANRGDKISGAVTFTNDLEQDFPLDINITANSFKVKDDYTLDETVKYPLASSLASWITFDKKQFRANRGESVQIQYTIRIPQNADYGGKYATIAFERNKQNSDEQTQLAIQIRLQFPILLNINGNRQEKLEINDFSTGSNIYENTDVVFNTLIRNTGNVHLSPFGNINIKGGIFGNNADLKFNPESESNSGYVLPEKDVTRKFVNEWKDDGLHFGNYTATLTMYFGTAKQQSATATTHFWIIPWKLILIALGIIILLIVTVVLRKKYKRAKKKKIK